MRQVLVRLLLPAGAPHQLEVLGQDAQVLAGRGRKVVVDAVHRLEAPRWTGVRVEAE
jgi:hypothetical protein